MHRPALYSCGTSTSGLRNEAKLRGFLWGSPNLPDAQVRKQPLLPIFQEHPSSPKHSREASGQLLHTSGSGRSDRDIWRHSSALWPMLRFSIEMLESGCLSDPCHAVWSHWVDVTSKSSSQLRHRKFADVQSPSFLTVSPLESYSLALQSYICRASATII